MEPMDACGLLERDRIVCPCLRVTERQVLAALAQRDIRTLHELRKATGAGEGCTACHAALRQLLDRHGADSAHG